MEIKNELLLDNKWEIIKEISQGPKSPTEIAISTHTSVSNIIQHLKILEAYNIVKKEKSNEKSSGKRKTLYTLSTEAAQIIYIKNGSSLKKTIKIEKENEFIINTITSTSPEDSLFIITFLIKYEDILKKCKTIGLLKTNKDNIEFFIITDYVDEIRANFSNIFIEIFNSRTKKIINWTHNEEEIIRGIERKEKYFIDLVKNSVAIHDPEQIIKKLKNIKN